MPRSVSGVLSLVESMPISCTSKRQVNIESSSYSTEFFAGRLDSEEAIALRYMLWSFSVTIKGATALYGDNLGMIISCTNPDPELKKKHVDISYHKLRECATYMIVNPI